MTGIASAHPGPQHARNWLLRRHCGQRRPGLSRRAQQQQTFESQLTVVPALPT